MTEDIDNDGIGEKVYYFSGNHKNNWVKFGKYTSDSDTIFDSSTFTSLSLWSANDDIYWKIIRINEDGSIRLLYTGTSTSTKTAYIGNSSPDYLGYMYGSDGSLSNLRLNTNSSSIKSKIDSWYETNLLSGYDKYVSKTAIYCNDRSLESGQKYYSNDEEREFYFSAYKRITSRSIPTYKCGGTSTGGLYESSQAIGDKFSVSKTNGGNGKLTYPVALMTADEIVYAGGVYGGNASDDAMVDPVWYYGNNGSTSWWVMTPEHQYSNGQRYLYYISNETVSYSSGGRTYYRGRLSTSMSESKAIRPVLSLKSCVKYASGDGSSTNPYTVTVDDDCANKEN